MSNSSNRKQWVRPTPRWAPPRVSRDAAIALQKSLGLHAIVAAVLVNRGFIDTAAASDFLSPKLDSLHDPMLMQDMHRAAPVY